MITRPSSVEARVVRALETMRRQLERGGRREKVDGGVVELGTKILHEEHGGDASKEPKKATESRALADR